MHTTDPLRVGVWMTDRQQRNRGILLDADIRVTDASRLRAKLMVFRSRLRLRRFWKRQTHEYIPVQCFGLVNGLSTRYSRIDQDGRETDVRLVVDPRYFCIIGLVKGYLGTEIITHESVHAAYAYAKRVRWRDWPGALDNDEEHVAYPTGLIAANIVRALRGNGLIE